MAPRPVMSRDEVDEATLVEIAEACHISADRIDDIYVCTPLQVSTLAQSTINTGTNAYRFVLALDESIDCDRLYEALRRVIALNAILRTRIVDSRRGLVQVVTSEEEVHCTLCKSGDGGDEAARYLRDHKERPYHLGMSLFHSGIIGGKLVLTLHHAIMDHWSAWALLSDILDVYHGIALKTHAPFKDFVAHCVSIDESAARSFWGSRFKGAPAIFPRVRPGHVPEATQTVIQEVYFNQIKSDVTLAHIPSFLEAAWALTAAVYSGSESVAFGLVLSGRALALGGAETTIGPTIATVPTQVNLRHGMTVGEIHRERTTALRQLQADPALQFGPARIREVSDAARVASGFQAVLNVRSIADNPPARYDHIDTPQGPFSLVLNCNIVSEGMQIEVMSDPSVLCETQTRRITQHFYHTLLSLMEADPQTKLNALPRLNPHDRLEISQWNEALPKSVDQCIHDLFSAQARENPEAAAVEASDGTASYRELDEMTDRLSDELRRRGVLVGSAVPFIFEKSLWAIVAILAIMKAGGACVPIEKSDPDARKSAIISRVKANTVLTSASQHPQSLGLAPDVFAVSATSISALPEIGGLPDHKTIISPQDLAYVVFTSGSTGMPKGVMLEHRCLSSSLSFIAQRLGWGPSCRILQFASHVWDASVGEMLGALLFGGCLCIPSEEARESGLVDFIAGSNVNWAWLTPTVIRTMSPDDVPGLKSLASAGEPVGPDTSKTWGGALRLFNTYAPCETSITSIATQLTPTSLYPETMGTAVGCAIWIVNPANTNELLPIGAVGELVIEGPGVTRGYLNDDVKTAASFISPPLWAPIRDDTVKKARFYRTGDLAKYNPDGSICFIGRRDKQVKIRGQRFELGELESVLADCDEVRDAFTTTKIFTGRTELVAVVSLSEPKLPRGTPLQELDVSCLHPNAELAGRCLRAVRDHVISKLPSYMVPTVWLVVEQLPRTVSAKLDGESIREWLKKKDLSSSRAALDGRINTTRLTPPATEVERLLQSLWSSVLRISKGDIGRESSFLRSGGDSILAMQVASRCRRRGYRITTASLLTSESLAATAESMHAIWAQSDGPSRDTSSHQNGLVNSDRQPVATILSAFNSRLSQLSHMNKHFRRGNLESVVRATDAQAAMLAAGDPADGDTGCYITFTLEPKPALDSARLRVACEQVVHHHPILRTAFVQHGPSLYQVTLKSSPTEAVIDGWDKQNSSPVVTTSEETALARFHLMSDGKFCYRFCLGIHHALYDAVSLGLIFRDLDAAYANKSLSDGPLFHTWVSHVEALNRESARNFWKETLQDSSMSYLVPPPPAGTIRAGRPLDKSMQIRVSFKNIQSSCGTPSSVLKAAWALLLSYALGEEDVVFGEVSANRYLSFSGIDKVRGPCVNTLPARAHLDQNKSLASLITQIQDQSIAAIPHHHLGNLSIIRDCTLWPSGTRFSSIVVYQNHRSLGDSLSIGGADCSLSVGAGQGDTADFWVMAHPRAEDLEIDLLYSSEAVPNEQADWISQCLLTILETISSSLDDSLSHVGSSIRNAMGSPYLIPAGYETLASSDGLDTHGGPPSDAAKETVSQAWKEMELLFEAQDEDCSMFNCGADIATALLLSQYYRYCGADVTTQDVVRHPSRSMQASLIEAKKAKATI